MQCLHSWCFPRISRVISAFDVQAAFLSPTVMGSGLSLTRKQETTQRVRDSGPVQCRLQPETSLTTAAHGDLLVTSRHALCLPQGLCFLPPAECRSTAGSTLQLLEFRRQRCAFLLVRVIVDGSSLPRRPCARSDKDPERSRVPLPYAELLTEVTIPLPRATNSTASRRRLRRCGGRARMNGTRRTGSSWTEGRQRLRLGACLSAPRGRRSR